MTAYQLSSARLVLERARLLLRDREDPDACELRGQVAAAISAIAVADGTTVSPEDAGYLLSQARSLTARTSEYAARHRLHFLIVLTPQPGQAVVLPPASDRALDSTELVAVIASIKPGERISTSVQDALEEAVLIEGNEALPHDTSPCPAPDTRDDLAVIPEAGAPESPTPPNFRWFHEREDADDD